MKYQDTQVGSTTVEIATFSYFHYKEMYDWCTAQFGETGNYADDTWASSERTSMGYTMFYFERKQDASFFKLRWA